MSDPQILKDLKPTKEFFIGIDSDGCVFDTMELKHKECFAPMFIKHFRLQTASKYAREVWDFVNLYSKSRGINRFPALVEALEWLERRPEVLRRGVYGGAVGYFDFGGDMDACIAIRTAVVAKGGLHIQAGAGIVFDSLPESELAECANKARALAFAARLAEGMQP